MVATLFNHPFFEENNQMFIIPYPSDRVEKNFIKVLDRLGPGIPRTLFKDEVLNIPGTKSTEPPFMPVGKFGISYKMRECNSLVEYYLSHETFGDLGTVILEPIGDGIETKIFTRHRVSPTEGEANWYYSKGWAGDMETSIPFDEKDDIPGLNEKLINDAYYFFVSRNMVERCEKIRNTIIAMIIKELKDEPNEPWKWIPDLSPEERGVYRKVWEARKEGLSWEKIAEDVEKAVNSVKSYQRKMLKVMKD